MFVIVTAIGKTASYFKFQHLSEAQGMARKSSVSWVSWFDNGKKNTFIGSTGTLKTIQDFISIFIMYLVTG
jgi:hypothetical protein